MNVGGAGTRRARPGVKRTHHLGDVLLAQRHKIGRADNKYMWTARWRNVVVSQSFQVVWKSTYLLQTCVEEGGLRTEPDFQVRSRRRGPRETHPASCLRSAVLFPVDCVFHAQQMPACVPV